MSDQTPYDVVAYRPAFQSQIVALQAHSWGADLDPAVCAAYLDWKYTRNPYADGVIHVVLRGSEVVGMRGLYGARWLLSRPARQLVGLCAGDLVIAPDHRHRGLFQRLARAGLEEAARRGYPYVFSFNPSPTTSLGLTAMGWHVLGSPEPMRWESRWRRLVRHVRDRAAWRRVRSVWQYTRRLGVARKMRESVERLSAAGRRTRRPPFEGLDRHGARARSGDPILATSEPEPEVLAELVERIGHNGRIRHVRDSEYFRWRFRNPASRYRFLLWKERARLEGYLVLQSSVLSDSRQINVVDWQASSGEVRAELLRAAVRSCRFEDLTIWSATLSEDARALLRDAGFRRIVEVSVPRRILVRSVQDELPGEQWVVGGRRLLDLADWDLRMVDSDAC